MFPQFSPPFFLSILSYPLGYPLPFPKISIRFWWFLLVFAGFGGFAVCLRLLVVFCQSYQIPWVTLCHQILMVVAGFGGFAFSFWLLVVLVVFGRPSLVVQPLPSDSDGC